MFPEQNRPDPCRSIEIRAGARVANPFLFVVGCPRSGTTLLQRLLDHHPLLAVANDTHFIPRCLEKLAPERLVDACAGSDVPLTPNLIDGVRSYHRFARLGLTDDDVDRAAREATTYGGYVAALYTDFARGQGKPLGGEKTPDYVRCLPLLRGLFPHASFLHIVRDGRDVALSVLDWANDSKGPGRLELWNRSPVATCALWWRWQVAAGRRAGTILGSDRYLEIAYDDLVADTDVQMRRVTGFAGLPHAPEMLAYHVGRVRGDRTLSAKSRWLPPTSGLRDWRTQMSESDTALFEAIAGDLLTELGMERACPTPSAAVRRIADSCIAWWDEHLDRRRARFRRRVTRRRRANGE